MLRQLISKNSKEIYLTNKSVSCIYNLPNLNSGEKIMKNKLTEKMMLLGLKPEVFGK